jgi:hypothetical protein
MVSEMAGVRSRLEVIMTHVTGTGAVVRPPAMTAGAAAAAADVGTLARSAAHHRLTPEQHSFFDTFGFLVFPGLLADCAGRIIESFEQVWADNGGGHNGQPHDNQRRSAILPFPDQSAFLSSYFPPAVPCSICGHSPRAA